MKPPWRMTPTELYAYRQSQVEQITAMLDIARDTARAQRRKHRNLERAGHRSPAGDEHRLRMIPVHAEGVAGAIPGTRPDQSKITH